MRIKRYVFTAIIAALFWPVVLYLLDNPLLNLMRLDGRVTAGLMLSLAFATLCGVWVNDAHSGWASGVKHLGGFDVMLSRFLIAFVSLLIFAIPYSMTITAFAGIRFSYMDALVSQGFVIVGTVWITTQVVDILARYRAI